MNRLVLSLLVCTVQLLATSGLCMAAEYEFSVLYRTDESIDLPGGTWKAREIINFDMNDDSEIIAYVGGRLARLTASASREDRERAMGLGAMALRGNPEGLRADLERSEAGVKGGVKGLSSLIASDGSMFLYENRAGTILKITGENVTTFSNMSKAIITRSGSYAFLTSAENATGERGTVLVTGQGREWREVLRVGVP